LALVFLFVGTSLPTAAQDGVPGGRFWDDDSNPHEANIEAIATVGITAGCSNPAVFYCPAQVVTRGQMAKFLTRAFALPPATGDLFTDDAGSFHEADINALAQAGITTGLGGGLYGPVGSVTREQMASFLARAMGLMPIPGDQFVDVTRTHEGDINAIASVGVTVGCDLIGPRYCPFDAVPREQMATFLARSRSLAPTAVTPHLFTQFFRSRMEIRSAPASAVFRTLCVQSVSTPRRLAIAFQLRQPLICRL
jgi:hypothetical protein